MANDFRIWFRVKASGSIGPMCLRSGRSRLRPPIVRDESSRVFLGGALQQSPPLRRPSSMVGQFSVEVNRKDEPATRRGAGGSRRQNRQKCGCFMPALTSQLGARRNWGLIHVGNWVSCSSVTSVHVSRVHSREFGCQIQHTCTLFQAEGGVFAGRGKQPVPKGLPSGTA
jgi:hypothetical protein